MGRLGWATGRLGRATGRLGRHPNRARADDDRHAAPERCLATHLFGDDDPVHPEVSDTGFEDEAGRRVEAVRAREE